ncbi:hypothetical protein SAMN02745163_02366 [Clostridium cavendishii DSM 21758]|uniref:Uncharacterized protein n=2 Tax=Clostridium TaxID=1485 RepID=A0A1M6LFE7_9CLOT|nr:hypothetical protein SAMN02745163_02366 [Clostridium cavendishii DSM 21758]
MNSLSTKEIENQLFFLSREAIKHIVLESKCGIVTSSKSSKKFLSNNDINILKDFSPLLCLYKKATPKIYSVKHSKAWQEDSFKKEILCFPNALMTLSLLELTSYYDKFKNINEELHSFANLYKSIAKLQLDFYSSYLRNSEGIFVDKKNSNESLSSEYNLVEKDRKFKFSDQAIMMVTYYLYSITCPLDKDSENFKIFSLDILNMFVSYKEEIYNLSFEECSKICFAFNVMYKYYPNNECKLFLIDISEFLISKSNESPLSTDELELSCFTALNLLLSYKNTNISSFKDYFEDITANHRKLYDSENGIFFNSDDKKECKYTSSEVTLYYLNLHMYDKHIDSSKELKTTLGNLYKQFFVNSGMVVSWPEAPSLDSIERYTNFSLKFEDLLEETMFRMPNLVSSDVNGMAPVFNKTIIYSKKKECFLSGRNTFDSSKNMLIIYLILFFIKENCLNSLIKTMDIVTREELSSKNEQNAFRSLNQITEEYTVIVDNKKDTH